MKLIELFDIIYCDQDIKETYSNFIDNFNCNNLLNTSKTLSTQFVLAISNNIVVNKTYNKLKLEFHNINNNSINSSLIIETLSKLQNIINDTLSDSEKEVIIENITHYGDDEDEDEDEDDEDEDDTSEEYDEPHFVEEDDVDIILPENVANDIKTILKKTEYVQIHILQKKYGDDKKLKYLTTFLLNDNLKIPDMFNTKDTNFGKDVENIDELFDIQHYYNTIYKNFNDFDPIYDYLDNYDIADDYLIKNLNKIMSGFYLNIYDIRFQIILKLILLTNIGDHGKIINYISYKKFNKNNSLKNYFIYDENNTNVFETLLIKNLHICCDICNTMISKDTISDYYHNDYGGDICDSCYANKKEQFANRIKYIKKRILMVGKSKVFENEVIKTRKFLKKKKFKMKKKNYYLLLEKMNTNLINEPSDDTICKICYNTLSQDIYVGSDCGHCFHKQCIEHCDKCQICRKETKFIKLFL